VVQLEPVKFHLVARRGKILRIPDLKYCINTLVLTDKGDGKF